MTFIDRLETLIEKKGISKKEFAENVGITTQGLYDWKKRNTIPSADIVCKIANILDTSVEYLVNGIEKDSYKIKYENLKSIIQKAINEN